MRIYNKIHVAPYVTTHLTVKPSTPHLIPLTKENKAFLISLGLKVREL